MGAVEGIATNSVTNAIGGQRSTVSDTSYAAAMGCASGSSSGGGDNSGSSSRSSKIRFDQDQLRDKFSKHAADFGVTGNSNPANWAKFREALAQFIDAPTTQAIPGTYRGTTAVTHYFDPATKLWVAVRSDGSFISGWRLTPDQVHYLLSTGNVQ